MRGLLSDMATPSSLSSQQPHTRVQTLTYHTHIGMCVSLHAFRNTELRLLLDVATPLFRFISTLHSLLAAGTITLTQTLYFCHRPQDAAFPLISFFFLRAFGKRMMGAWRDLGHGWVVGNQSAVRGLTAWSPLFSSLAPPFFLYLFLFWQRIIGGFMQIAYFGLKRSGKTCPVNAMFTFEPCSTLKRCTHGLSISLGWCAVMIVCVLPPHSLWRGPSPSWSPGCPGWSSPVGRGESLPQNGWSYASQSLNLKHIH